MKNKIVVLALCLLLSGCITLQVDKPIILKNINYYPDLKETPPIEEKIANSFNDKRRYIFKALVGTPCFLPIEPKIWESYLIQYNKEDIDGFIEWCSEEILYNQSGGTFLTNYFKGVKRLYDGYEK